MKTSPHVFKTSPRLVSKVWGGRRLDELFGKELEDDGPYGESWEVADLQEGQCRVGSGPLAGLPLRALSEGWERGLVGRRAPRPDRFPILAKLLDAQDDLSVQVHPGPRMADRTEGADSKQETWLVLDAEDDACIIHGLTREVTDQEFRRAAKEGRLEELLHRVSVEKGDVIDIEPGTIHAICGGVALLEIQEPSDTTYRVYDYDRPGLDGQPRELHLDEAIEAGRLGPSDRIIRKPKVADKGVRLLSETRSYRIERLEISDSGTLGWQVDPDSPQILHLVEGSMVLEDGIGGKVELETWETAVVPAILGSVRAQMKAPCSVVVAGLPVEQLVREPCRIKKSVIGC